MPPKSSEKEAEKIVFEYLTKQNRPYNAQILFDNLHGSIGKTQLTKILTSLCDTKKICGKEFGKQKIYWANQDTLQDEEENVGNVEQQISQFEKEKAPLAEEVKKQTTELQTLNSQPSTKDAEERIKFLTKENAELTEKLSAIAENRVVITPEEKKEAEKLYEQSKQLWRKRKRTCKEIFGFLEEVSGKRYKELKEDLGIEDDESVGVNIDDDETSKLKKI